MRRPFLLLVLALCCAVPLVLLPVPLAALLVIGLIALTLALLDPVWALYGVVLSVPVQDLILLPGGLSVTQATLALAAATWGLHVLAYPERAVVAGRVAVGLVVLVWTMALASLTSPYSQTEGLKETLRWASVLLVYLLALNITRPIHPTALLRSWRGVGLVVCLLLAPAANGVYGLWQFITASGPPGFVIAGGRFVRAYGTIGQPNSFAGAMNMAWPLAVALVVGAALREYHRWRAATAVGERYPIPSLPTLAAYGGVVAAAGVLVAALGASFSRGGWVGAVAGGGVLLVALVAVWGQSLQRKLWLWAGMAGAAATLLLLIGSSGLLPETVTQRVSSIGKNLRLFDVRTVQPKPENFAVAERMAQLQSSWAMVVDHPLTGVGPGSYTLAYEGRTFPLPSQPYSFHPWYASRGHAHNYYLHSAVDSGLLGLAAYMLLLVLLVVQAYASLRRIQQAQGWFWHSVAAGGCGIIAGVATHNLLENLHVLNMGVQLGAVWGIVTAIEQWQYDDEMTMTDSLRTVENS